MDCGNTYGSYPILERATGVPRLAREGPRQRGTRPRFNQD
jgi:hypothetical protein